MGGTLARLNVLLGMMSGDFDKGIDKAESKLKAFAGKMKSVGQKMTLAVTTPLLGMAAVAIDAASDLNESLNKTNVVFGQSADTIVSWSKTSATAMGLSQQAALEAAGTYGNLFTSIGLNDQAAADMSKSLVQLAADQASFNNLPTDDVLAKIQAGLVGEYEGLRQLGIVLDATTVKEEAMRMGLAATEEQLTASDLATARYELIMRQSGNAMGDFSETSGSFANQMKIVRAQITNTAATLGTILLPYVLRGLQLFQQLIARFQELSPRTQKIILVVAGLAAAIGPLLLVLGHVITALFAIGPAIAFILGPIGLVIAALVLLAVAYKKNWLGIADITNKVVKKLVAAFKQVVVIVRTLVAAFKYFRDSGFTPLGAAIQALTTVFPGLSREIRAVGDAINRGIQFWNAMMHLVNQLREAFGVNGLSGALAILAARLDEALGATATQVIISALQGLITVLSIFASTVRDSVVNAFQLVANLLRGDFRGAFDELVQFLVGPVVGLFNAAMAAIRAAIQAVFGSEGVAVFDRFAAAVGSFAQTIAGWITGTAIPAIVGFWNTVSPYLESFGSWLLDTGIPAVQQFAQAVWSWINNVAWPAFRVLLDKANEYLVPVFQWMGGPGLDALVAFAEDVARYIGDAAKAFQTMWNMVNPILRLLQQWLTTAVLWFLQLAISAQQKLDNIGGYFSDLWDDISGFVSDVADAFSTFAEDVAGYFKPLIDKINEVIGLVETLIGWLNKVPIIGGGAGEAQADIRSLETMFAGGVAGEKALVPPGSRRGVLPPYQGSRSQTGTTAFTSGGAPVTGLPAVGTGPGSPFGSWIAAAATAATQVAASVGKILAVVASMASGVPTMVNAMAAKVSASFAQMGATVPTTTTAMTGRVLAAFATLASNVPALTTAMVGRVLAAFASMSSDVSALSQSTSSRVSATFSTMRSAVTSTVNQMVGQVLVSMVSLSSQMGALGQAAGNSFRSGIASGFAGAVAAAASGAAQIRAAASIGSLFGQGFAVGASLGQGIAAGIQSYVGSVASAAAAIVGAAVSAARTAAAASSPSRKMMALGEDMVAGLLIPLNRAQGDVTSALAGLVSPPGVGGLAGAGLGGIHIEHMEIRVDGAGEPEAVADEVFLRFSRAITLREGI